MAEKQRLYQYDVVRSVAILFVVAVHSLVVVDQSSTVCAWYYMIFQTIFFTGNAMFFMLSGKFNLRERTDDESVKRYYYNKARNILVPVIVIFLLRTLYDLYPTWDFSSYAKNFVVNFVYGYSSMEYWFVFVLMGFLVVAPFLGHAFSRLSKLEIKIFVVLGLAYHLVLMILDNRGVPLGWSFLFGGFAFTFCLGALVEKIISTDKRFKQLECLAVICLLITVYLMSIGLNSDVHDKSPFYTILAVGIYMAILRWGASRKKESKFVSFAAKHSFSIYLVHMTILLPLTRILPPFSGVVSLAAHLGVTVVVFALSLLLAAVLDRLVMEPLKKLFDKSMGKLVFPKEPRRHERA